MENLIKERLELINRAKEIIKNIKISEEEKNIIKEKLIKQFLYEEFVDDYEKPETPIEPELDYMVNTVADLKKRNYKIGDIVTTKGYYSVGDGGEARYIIQDYDYYLNTWLPADCRKVGVKPTMCDVALKDTPVDEYGNHTLNNSLVACLFDKENIKAEQYGAKGDGKSDNIEPFIHLFAHMKHGKITLKKDGIYLIGQRKQENIPSLYSFVDNPYRAYMSGRGSYTQKPIMANIDGVEIVGENSTIKIKDNDFCNTGKTTDMAILHLFRFIRNLKIHGIIFDNNGLTMDASHVVSNHGIIYKSGNSALDGGKLAPYSEVKDEISNIEIYDCEFKEGGTRKNVQDVGGDGILIINPSELSHDINIHNNKFINWGRWCFAIDLGGNGECIENVKFNNNYCFQDASKNTSSYGGCRGLGWIDFEARKCFKNLEVCNNYVDGWHGFAFNGAGKVSENVTIKNNIMANTTVNTVGSKGYPYTYNFYGVQAKNLVFENNTITPGSMKLGYTFYNATIRNNKFPSTTDGFGINGAVGDIIIEGNEREDRGQFCSIEIEGDLPDYLTEEEKENLEVNLIFRNNKGGLVGGVVNKEKRGYKKVTLEIKGNEMKKIDFIVNNAHLDNDFSFDVSQIINIDTLYAFGCRGAKFNGLTTLNYRGIPNGGGYYKIGDIIAETDTKQLVCHKEGYLLCQGSFLVCESDMEVKSINKTSELGVARRFILTDDSVYYVTKKGNINGQDFPNHKEGYANWGDVTLLYVCERGNYETINKEV